MTDLPDFLTETPPLEDTAVDVLSDVLRVVRLTGGVFLDAEFTAPWCLSGKVAPEDCLPFLPAPRHVIAYHYIVSGRLMLRPDGGEAVEVSARQIVLLPHNDRHLFGSDLSLRPADAHSIIEMPTGSGLARIVYGGGGEATHMVCGFLGCDVPFNPLLQALPMLLKLDIGAGEAGAWIESSFHFAASEIAAGRIGSTTVMSRLSELLFIEAIRRYVATRREGGTGWLAGLGDRYVGRALAALHARPRDAWTAESLATEVGLSRSAFAERFVSLVGQPPMQYLMFWRMYLAADRLRSGAQVAKVAYEVGYESEAAFSRAFKRQFGCPPAKWRLQLQ
jgi:AraC-like DNA-binding protein